MVTADYDLVPDDPLAYREALIDAFARRGVYPDNVKSLSEDALLWRSPQLHLSPVTALHFANLRFAGDPGRAAGSAQVCVSSSWLEDERTPVRTEGSQT